MWYLKLFLVDMHFCLIKPWLMVSTNNTVSHQPTVNYQIIPRLHLIPLNIVTQTNYEFFYTWNESEACSSTPFYMSHDTKSTIHIYNDLCISIDTHHKTCVHIVSVKWVAAHACMCCCFCLSVGWLCLWLQQQFQLVSCTIINAVIDTKTRVARAGWGPPRTCKGQVLAEDPIH